MYAQGAYGIKTSAKSVQLSPSLSKGAECFFLDFKDNEITMELGLVWLKRKEAPGFLTLYMWSNLEETGVNAGLGHDDLAV